MFNFRIYARFKNEKRFNPLGNGGTTKNLIHAEHWPTLEKCQQAFDHIVSMNPDIEFKMFDVKKDKYITA